MIGTKKRQVVTSIVIPVTVNMLQLNRNLTSHRVTLVPTADLAVFAERFDQIGLDPSSGSAHRDRPTDLTGKPLLDVAINSAVALAAVRAKLSVTCTFTAPVARTSLGSSIVVSHESNPTILFKYG